MTSKPIMLLFFCVFTSIFTYAQNQLGNKPAEPVVFTVASVSPYYVLKAGDKSVGIELKGDDKFDIQSIDPKGIKEIHVLKGEDATRKYGEQGINGVVIIYFKDTYVLPLDLQARFDKAG